MGEDMPTRAQERENLRHIIQQWNDNRLDLFEISEPDENLLFHGVMRYYYQESGQKIATKCIRVSSTSTVKDVINTLIEKFRPDMRMLSKPVYTLYEVHQHEERRLEENEKPLLVQLNWNKDDREGRFLLKRIDLNGVEKVKTLPPVPSGGVDTFVRKLSRREKKELKRQEKIQRHALAEELHAAAQGDQSVAEKLYTELPETSFTRSISNPEAVMRRRRAQKLEKKLQQFRSKNGGPDTGGTLKIYGESLCKDVPYKTLLLSVRETAGHVVKEMLEKYGLTKEDPNNYCLVQCIVTAEETLEGYEGKIVPQKEYILDDDECPLAILMNHPPSRGSIMFQVRRRPTDHGQRKRKKKPLKGNTPIGGPQGAIQRHSHGGEIFPFLVEIGPEGNEMSGKGRQIQLQLNVTEVGSDRIAQAGGAGQQLHLIGPYIQPRHCVIAHTDGIVTVTPCSRDAETYVNQQRIYETTILQHGAGVRFGRTNNFRFIDPQHDDRFRRPPYPQPSQQAPYFDRFGPEPPPGSLMGSHFGSRASSIAGSQTSIARPPFRVGSELHLKSTQEPWNNYERYGPPRDPILPAVLEFREDVEDTFFHNIITQLDPTDIQFKLGPTYTLYMAARFRASTHYRPDLSPPERAHNLTIMLARVSDVIRKTIEFKQRDPTALAFWMANASELLHFLKQDRHICGYSVEAQDILAEAVQFAFRRLVDCMQMELSTAMPLFLEDRNDRGEEEGCTAHVLSILTNTMALLRRCRVNAALTIQLFSQLFHFVNMWVFNKVVLEHNPNYCTREWGERLKERLSRIELWAEKQGLELAADCHLAKLSQAALLLTSPKSSPDDVTLISSTCFKLNSLQLREILEKYQPVSNEPSISKDLIDNVVSVAETTADGLAREDGREIRLDEDADLQLPFLLPEDGYSCDILRGIPSGLAEFLEPLQRAQLCRLTPQPTSSGFWTIYMHNHQEIMNQRVPPGPRSPSAMSNRSVSIPRGEPEVHVIELHKSNSGMGLSIVATKGENQDKLGIYIKSVVRGGAADQDGRLQAGDQLLSVDGQSLVGVSQEDAAKFMMHTGPVVTLHVARQGALYHGLAPLLTQGSPPMNTVVGRRGSNDPYHGGTPENYNERLVDWNRQPKGQSPGQRPPLPLPETSPPSNRQFSSEFPNPTPKAYQSMSNSRSSPNLAGPSRLSGPQMDPRRDGPLNSQRPPQQLPHDMQQFRQQPYSQKPNAALYPPSKIQPSKSVPSLNTEPAAMNNRSGVLNSHMHGYPRANSATSLPQQPPARSKSTQNLSEGGNLSISARHPSNPILSTEDDRHYQNVSFHQGVQDPRMGSQKGTRPVFPTQMNLGQENQRPTSAFLQRDDPRNESLHRPSSQLNIRQDPRMSQFNESMRRREERFNGHAYPGPTSPMPQSPHGAPIPAFQRPPQTVRPQNPYPQGYPGQNTAFTFPQGPGNIRGVAPPPQMSPHVAPPQQLSPQYANSLQGSKLPPPIAPKPNRNSGSHMEAPEKPVRQPGMNQPLNRAGLADDEYRESPPPPPPPTSTHPLLQTNHSSIDTAKLLSVKGPWLKDDKQRYEQKKRELLRRRRDEHIASLEQLEMRSPQEEEKLRTLKLEREFQIRAEQEDQEDEEDDVEPTDVDQKFSDKANGTPNPEDRNKKADEIRRKQQELEDARVAEERLLREAHRRQEEEQTRRSQHQRHQQYASQRLDTLVGSNGSDRSGSPLPPERNSSYGVMQQSPVSSMAGRSNRSSDTPVKKVQFSATESVETHFYDDNANQEKLVDPNDFFNEADTMLNANTTPPNINVSSTPGVIGAQEIYRDPRQRRLAEAAEKAAASRSTGPEKLTFREKMKMFAKETGDPDTPKDKAKTSKAQREIEFAP